MRNIVSPRAGLFSLLRRHKTGQRRRRSLIEGLESRMVLSGSQMANVGDVFYIDMENHNLTQPTGLSGSPEQLMGNPAAPYLNSLMTPGNANAAQTSYASNYYNADSTHPSEPNYIWQESGTHGPLNDSDPYPSNIVNAPNLSALLQTAGISWKSYQEDIDLSTNGSGQLTYQPLPQNQWTVPLQSVIGSSTAYTNPYNHNNYYGFAAKHDGQLFFTATNGSTSSAPDLLPSNPEVSHYDPLQQLQTDLNQNAVGRYNLITPDLYNDMHNSLPADKGTTFTYNGVTYDDANKNDGTDQEAIAEGDNFLSQIIPMIEASQAYKNNGAIVIWFDESEGGSTSQYTIPEIVISPLAKGNAYDSTQPYTHSSDLKTMQELFNVPAPGGGFLGDANTAGTNDLADLFKPVSTSIVATDQTYVIGSGTATVSAADGLLSGDTGPTPLSVTAGTVAGAQGGSFAIKADGSFTYTPGASFAGYDSAQFTVTDTAGDQTTATVTVLSQHAAVVWKFYESVLDRTPEPSGLQYWTNDFNNGGKTGDIAFGFFESDELLDKVLGNYYEQYLLRPLDAGGLAYWKSVWHATGGPEQIKAGFADSPEFYSSAGGSPQSWLTALYQRILNRTPDPAGQSFWTNFYQQQTAAGVAAGTIRYEIALGFFDSPEAYGNDVAGWFQEYLFRAPTAAEATQYVDQMQAGASDRTIEQEITNLPEYANNPPTPAAGTSAALPDFYQKGSGI
ncbi:MAG: hypothetical protein B7Z73_03420 [Planctomycetia bacterium 21-64-5]|nr:MAG: hypothetical protein B7Z73_03420 [Planctomycetia bacterium 21-64-5]HQU41781.1 DUF4214 domain-containing protein [Pirellulales bacterium]